MEETVNRWKRDLRQAIEGAKPEWAKHWSLREGRDPKGIPRWMLTATWEGPNENWHCEHWFGDLTEAGLAAAVRGSTASVTADVVSYIERQFTDRRQLT